MLCIIPGKYFYSLYICLHSIVKTLLICGRYFRCAKFWYGPEKEEQKEAQKLHRTGGQWCKVAVYELLVLKHPTKLNDHGPLYLPPIRKERQWTTSLVWFSKTSLGVHSINNFVNKMAAAAGLDVAKKHYTNHSIRKTTVKKLRNSGALRTVRVFEIHFNAVLLMLYLWNSKDLSLSAQRPHETPYTLGVKNHKLRPLVPDGQG